MARRDTQVFRIVKELKDFTDRHIKKIALDLTAELVKTTPVDTGWARGNWIPKIGSIFAIPAATRETVSNAEAIQQEGITEVATRYTIEKGSIFIANNVPYIRKLDMGGSSQAPAGFVGDAVKKTVAKNS